MLFADRFLPLDRGGRFLDLASGRTVVIRRRPVAPREQDAWLQRCARLTGLWHPHLAALIDYGIANAGERFEVLPLAAVAPVDSPAVAAGIRSALWFLGAVGVAAGPPTRARIRALQGRVVLFPDDCTGYALELVGMDAVARWRRQWTAVVGDGTWERPIAGLVLRPRRVLHGLIEILEQAETGRAGQIVVAAPPGAGLSTLADALAREARQRAYLPVASTAARDPRIAGLALGDALRDRFVMFLGDARREPSGRDRLAEAWFLGAVARSGRPSFLVTLARDGSAPYVVPLDPLPSGDLVEAAFIHPPVARSRVARAAERAMGRPGCFLAALGVPTVLGVGQAFTPAVAGSPHRIAAVAETQPAYVVPFTPPARRWHVRAERALALAKMGRHAAAERGLREAAAALRRHGDEAGAARWAAALGRILLSRGRPRDARDAFESCMRPGEREVPRDAAIAIGHCLIDEGRLREAEAALRAACSLEDDRQDPDDAAAETDCADGPLALARCLYWQGRYDEAAEWIASAVERRRPRALRLMSALDLARQEVAAAGRLALGAIEAAAAAGDHGALAGAHAAAIRALGELGDRDAVLRHRRDGLLAARRGPAGGAPVRRSPRSRSGSRRPPRRSGTGAPRQGRSSARSIA